MTIFSEAETEPLPSMTGRNNAAKSKRYERHYALKAERRTRVFTDCYAIKRELRPDCEVWPEKVN
jgi:hypothetical protein